MVYIRYALCPTDARSFARFLQLLEVSTLRHMVTYTATSGLAKEEAYGTDKGLVGGPRTSWVGPPIASERRPLD